MSGNARIGAVGACLAACLLIGASSAAAGGCPTKPVAESGGQHWCYSLKRLGHVHLWKPDGYAAKSATTVVYLHGHDIDASPRGKAHYLDRAWDDHHLADQFAASSLNALFVAVEGPINNRQDPKWTSLDALLRSIKRHGGLTPPGSVTVAAHSAGIFTAVRFLGDKRLVHLIVLDATYQDAPRRIARWFKASRARRLTLVGADSCHAGTAALAKKLGCSAKDAGARCFSSVDASLGHMDVVLDGKVIPQALRRAVTSKPRKKKKP
jgi:hypothetical protein